MRNPESAGVRPLGRAVAAVRVVPRLLGLGLIRAYQLLISPVLAFFGGPGSGCRFHPTCSHYAAGAVSRHGLLAGSWLAAKRLAKCHPWHAGGVDPVPELSPFSLKRIRPDRPPFRGVVHPNG